MQFVLRKSQYSLLMIVAASLLALTFGGVARASLATPGVSPFVELEGSNANEGFNALPGSTFDWANAGANSPRSCTSTPVTGGLQQSCTGAGGLFDGGIFVNSTTPPIAPAATAAALADPTIVAIDFGVDPLSIDVTSCGTGDTTVYTGVGGETNGDVLNTETFGTGSIPNKDDISNVFAIAHQDPPHPAVSSPTDTNEIYAGFERVVNNGDSHVDLEFLQSAVTLVPGSKPAAFPCAGKLSGHRSQGDLLLSVDFTTGGTIGVPILHQWDCGTTPASLQGTICDPGKGKTTAKYVELTDPVVASAISQGFNQVTAVGCGGWGCRNADGTQTTSINTVELYEVGIDLAAIKFNGCLSTFLPHTRSSQSFTATLKDFEVIPFNTCAPSTRLTKTADKTQITTGDSVTYTYTEENTGNVALTNPRVEDDKCSPVTFDSGDTNNNGILDPGESFVFKCTQSNITANVTNIAIGHGTFTIGGVAKDVTFCPDPNNHPANVICANDCDTETRENCERDSLTVTVKTPSTALVKTATPSVVTTVLYKYAETNDGDIALTSPTVEDAECTSNGGTIALDSPSGDANSNGNLDPGETFHFKCTATYTGAGSHTDIGIAHGCFTSGGATKDVTVSTATSKCGTGSTIFADSDETDTKTVTITAPTVSGGK